MANAPVTTLEIVQAGFETTPGTLIAATRVVDFLPGTAMLRRTFGEIAVPRAGSRSGPWVGYPGIEDVEIDIEADVSTDDWPWWMNLFLAPLTTGVGAGTAKTYTQAPADTNTGIGTASTNAAQSASFEVTGKDTWPAASGAFKIAGCIGKTLDLTIVPEDVWKAKFTVQGMVTTQAAMTAALTNRAIAAFATGPQTKVYLDTTANTFGTTQLVGRGVNADLKFDLRPIARHTLDGTTTPYRMALPEAYQVTAKVTAEFSAITEYNAWAAKTAQRLQLAYVGPSITGGGNHTIQLNLPGEWHTADIVANKNVWAITLEMTQLYDSSILAAIQSVTINALATLP